MPPAPAAAGAIRIAAGQSAIDVYAHRIDTESAEAIAPGGEVLFNAGQQAYRVRSITPSMTRFAARQISTLCSAQRVRRMLT